MVYRSTTDFKIKVLDAYCPHMGADLSKGEVQGDHLICPFHLWSWGGDGVCKDIPYSDNIPAKARIKSWDVTEKNGLYYVWYDHEGNPPIEGQEPPTMDEYYSDEWSEWHMSEMQIKNNSRELIDNMADLGHFGPVHHAAPKTFKNIVEGHMFTQYMEGDPNGMDNTERLESTATYFGPGIMTTHMLSESDGLPRHSRLLVSHVPID